MAGLNSTLVQNESRDLPIRSLAPLAPNPYGADAAADAVRPRPSALLHLWSPEYPALIQSKMTTGDQGVPTLPERLGIEGTGQGATSPRARRLRPAHKRAGHRVALQQDWCACLC